jgi:hypothetical protein
VQQFGQGRRHLLGQNLAAEGLQRAIQRPGRDAAEQPALRDPHDIRVWVARHRSMAAIENLPPAQTILAGSWPATRNRAKQQAEFDRTTWCGREGSAAPVPVR